MHIGFARATTKVKLKGSSKFPKYLTTVRSIAYKQNNYESKDQRKQGTNLKTYGFQEHVAAKEGYFMERMKR